MTSSALPRDTCSVPLLGASLFFPYWNHGSAPCYRFLVAFTSNSAGSREPTPRRHEIKRSEESAFLFVRFAETDSNGAVPAQAGSRPPSKKEIRSVRFARFRLV